jgi:LmbE family N-acetylglucosaminyl deacetylase
VTGITGPEDARLRRHPAGGWSATPLNPVADAIERGVPLLVVAPHSDDAVLSCGALMIHAVGRTRVTVITLFTEAGPPPYTLSARRYLRQVGVRDAETLYRQRRAEDRAVLEPMGIGCVHAGLTDAQFRRRPHPGRPSRCVRLLPEVTHIYPVYRLHVVSGRIAKADAGTLLHACASIQRAARPGPALVVAPLGVGRHVDHVLARTAAERSGARVAYYSDFPYNQRHRPDGAFIRRHGLIEARWSRLSAKAELIKAYQTQAPALFRDGQIPLRPEAFYFPGPAGRPTGVTT